MALRTVGVRLAAEVSAYMQGMARAKAATTDFAGQLDKAARAGNLDAVADQAGAMGLGLVAAFGVAVGAAARFDKQMSEVAAVSNATAAEMERLRGAALQAGKDTAFSATEAAKAQAELAKAGLTTSQILGGALDGALALAAAGSLDLAESADIAAKTMNVFGLEGKDVTHIADVLAATANKSATDVHEMGEALKMGGLAANAAGVSLEETAGTLAALADNALVGSDAGTSLKTVLMFLQAPSEKAANLMKTLGINVYDASGNFIGMAKLAGVLQTALGRMSQEQRNAALATIFGADGMRAANILYKLGEKGLNDYTAAVNDQGAAAEVAAKKMDNLAGDIEKLKGSLETMAIEAGSGANGGLRTLVQALDALVNQVGSLPPGLSSVAVMAAGVGGAALLMAAGWVKARRATADAVAELRAAGPAGNRAASALEVTSKWAGRAAVAFVALEIAAAGVRAAAGKDLNPQVDALAKGLQDWANNGTKAGEASRLLGDDFEHLAYDLGTLDSGFWTELGNGVAGVIEGFTGLGSVADESLEHAKERLNALDQALTQMVTSGQGDAAAKIFAKIAEEAARQGVSVNELKKGLPGYAAALETAGTASEKTAGAIGGVAESADEAAKRVEELKQAFDDLFDVQMDLDEATIAYRQGIEDLNEELRKGARDTRVNTEEGRKNRSEVLSQISNINALRNARIAHGESLDSANAKYIKDIDGLRAQMRQAGFTKAQIEELTGAYRRIPGQVKTAVSAPGAATAINQAAELKRKLDALRSKTVRIHTQYFYTSSGDFHVPGGTITRAEGGITLHAREGLLREPAMFSPQGPARFAFAEPATGGEAFIPRFGNQSRSLAIADQAARWHGGMVVPQGGGGVAVTIKVEAGSVTGADRARADEFLRMVQNKQIRLVANGVPVTVA